MWLIYLILFLFIFIFVYDKLTEKYINPYKLIMIFGKKGSGKTTYLTKVAINAIKKGQRVYSTIEIPGTIYFNVNDIGTYTFLPNSVVLIDEVGMIWDNRDFKNFRSDVRDFFKYQRQYKLKVYLFSQTFDVDLKLRNLTDEMYLLRNRARVFSVARKINKNITIQQGDEGKASTLVDNYEFAGLLQSGAFKITFIPRWTAFYNSYDPKKLPYVTGTIMPMNEYQIASMKAWYRYKYLIAKDMLHDKANYEHIKQSIVEKVRKFGSETSKKGVFLDVYFKYAQNVLANLRNRIKK